MCQLNLVSQNKWALTEGIFDYDRNVVWKTGLSREEIMHTGVSSHRFYLVLKLVVNNYHWYGSHTVENVSKPKDMMVAFST